MQTIVFRTNTIIKKETKNGDTILQFINKDGDSQLIQTNSATEINICIPYIQGYWILDKKPYVPSLSNTDFEEVQKGSLVLSIHVNGIIYQFQHEEYSTMKEILEEFKSHYLVE